MSPVRTIQLSQIWILTLSTIASTTPAKHCSHGRTQVLWDRDLPRSVDLVVVAKLVRNTIDFYYNGTLTCAYFKAIVQGVILARPNSSSPNTAEQHRVFRSSYRAPSRGSVARCVVLPLNSVVGMCTNHVSRDVKNSYLSWCDSLLGSGLAATIPVKRTRCLIIIILFYQNTLKPANKTHAYNPT